MAHYEEGDVVEMRFNPPAGRVLSPGDEWSRRGVVRKVERSSALVAWDDPKKPGRLHVERVLFNRLRLKQEPAAIIEARKTPIRTPVLMNGLRVQGFQPKQPEPDLIRVPLTPPRAAERAEPMRRRSEIETITPQQATELLNANTDNRPIRDSRVAELVRTINERRWHLTNDAVAVTGLSKSKPGRLLNGQHRLFACVEANQPIEVLMLYGADEASFPVLDTGSRRAAGDLIGGTYHNTVAAVARLIISYERGGISIHGAKGGQPQNDEVLAAAKAHPLIHACCERYYGRLLRLTRSGGGVLAGMTVIAEQGGDEAHAFFERVIEGTDLAAGSPEFTLRARLIREATARRSKKHPSSLYMAMVIKAWNASRTGSSLSVILFNEGETFPQVAPLNAKQAPPNRRKKFSRDKKAT